MQRRLAILSVIVLMGSVMVGTLYTKRSYQILTTPVSPLYYIKVGREFMQFLFVFGDEDKANWYFTLAGKRTNEAKILKAERLNRLAIRQIDMAKKYQAEGEKYLAGLIDKADVNYLIQKSQETKGDIEEFTESSK